MNGETEAYCDWTDALDLVTGCSMFGRVFQLFDQMDELQGMVEQIYCECILFEEGV